MAVLANIISKFLKSIGYKINIKISATKMEVKDTIHFNIKRINCSHTPEVTFNHKQFVYKLKAIVVH